MERPIVIDFVSTNPTQDSGFEKTYSESLGPEALAGDLMNTFKDKVRINHFDTQLDSLNSIVDKLLTNNPDIIPINVKIGALNQLSELLSKIHSNGYNGIIALGGVVPTFASEQLLERYPDAVIGTGEGEMTMRGLVKVVSGEQDFDNVPNLIYMDQNGPRTSSKGTERINLSELSYPARITTTRIHDERNGLVWFEGSRGCDGHCTFCSRESLRGSGFSGELSPEHVVEDLSRLKEMGINEAHASDDDWAGDTERIDQIAQGILDLNLEMRWSVSTRADNIYKERKQRLSVFDNEEENKRLIEIWKKQKEAGCERVFIGLESFSPSQLKRYGKGISVAANYKAIEILREIGIDPVAGYIPIDPLMNLSELQENLIGLRSTGMYKGVSRVLRQLRIQEGSTYIEMVKRRQGKNGSMLMGERTKDLVFYDTIGFADPRVQKIADMSEKWNTTTDQLDKALNSVLFVTFAGDRPNGSVGQIAEWGHAQLTEIGMLFMESAVDFLLTNPLNSKQELENIQRFYHNKKNELITLIQSKLKQTGASISENGFNFIMDI